MSKKLIYLICFVFVLALVGTNVAFGQLVWEGRISSADDDMEEYVASGAMDPGSGDLEITEEGDPGSNQFIGLRFTGVVVPQGATITNAYVQFHVDETSVPGDNRPGTKFLRGEAVDNAAAISTTAPFNISSRPTTSAEASWDWPFWTTTHEEGPDQRTSDISAVIEEIVGRPGWSPGNSLVLIITGSGENTAEAFDGEPDSAALLHIEFTSKYAMQPSPADGAMYESIQVSLSWLAGETAASHDVYLGDNFDDVNDGTPGSSGFLGNQDLTFFIAGFPGMSYPDLVPGTTYYWRIDEVEADGTTTHKGYVWSFWIPPRIAYEPDPPDGAKFVDPNADLSWAAGLGAMAHYVFFGDNFDDVNNATTGGTTQGGTTYDPGPMELGKDYYWRVDEFELLGGMHKGDVWSFKTLPDIPITDPNLVGWWTLDEGMGTTAVDWSGYNHHGTFQGDPQWVDGYDGGALELDGSGDIVEAMDYKGVTGTHSRTVSAWFKTATTGEIISWGANTAGQKWIFRVQTSNGTDGAIRVEVNGGYIVGATDVRDDQWHHGAAVLVDDGSPDVTEIKLYLDGALEVISAQLDEPIDTASSSNVRIGQAPWGSRPFIGQIDNVRIYDKALTQEEIPLAMRGDLTRAWNPSPANRSTPDIEHATPLTWSPGDKVSQHDVYFGIDRDAVNNADTSDTTGVYRAQQIGTSYTPPEGVEWDSGPYYWRVDENNTDGMVTKGGIWSFTVADYLIVDDFESYNDIPEGQEGSNLVYITWEDGYLNPATNGSTIGYVFGSSLETVIVHGGDQSVPYFYDNSVAAYSEATRTFAVPQDWTAAGVQILALYFYGSPGNTGQLYVKVNGTRVPYGGDAGDIAKPWWKAWNIDLASFGTNLQSVTTLTIGIDGSGTSGTLFFDDIRLYRLALEPPEEIWLEAEAADTITSPMKTYDDPLASGGRYIGTDEGIGNLFQDNPPADGIATYSFAAQEGTYKILFRVIADADTGSNSFWVRIPGATSPQITRSDGWVNTNPMDEGDTWHWDEIHNEDQNENIVHFTLPAGQHTLEIARREDGTLLDAIVITDDVD